MPALWRLGFLITRTNLTQWHSWDVGLGTVNILGTLDIRFLNDIISMTIQNIHVIWCFRI